MDWKRLRFVLLLLLLPFLGTSFVPTPIQQQFWPSLLISSSSSSSSSSLLATPADRRQVLSNLGSIIVVGSSAVGVNAGASTIPTTTTTTTTTASRAVVGVPTPPFSQDLNWPLGKVAFSLLPLAGTYSRRVTVEEEIVPRTIWTHDQLQGVVNVNVPVRQTVIALSPAAGGGLWVHNPVAPTQQLMKMMKRLEADHGPVRHIVLGTVALEHKATFGPFSRQFPNATVWIQPGQWSFPLPLTIEELGVTQRGPRLREIPIPNQPVTSSIYQYYAQNPPEWAADFEWETLGPLKFKSVGGFSETAFYHPSTKTLIVTDTVVSVTDDPPPIIAEDPRAMLFHARDSIDEIVEDTKANRQRGWRRMVQFGLVFFPSQIEVVSAGDALQQASHIDPRMKNLGQDAVPFSLYPWTWHANNADQTNFQIISRHGTPFCPPILTKLILDREPTRTIAWVDKICRQWKFERVIPAHLNNNIKCTPKQFSAAFDMLRSTPSKPIPQRPLPEDLALLQRASDVLTQFGIVGPSQVCDGEPARNTGRFVTSAKTR